MNEHKETLSALMDGEANALELRRVLKSMQQSPDVAQQWQRLQLVSAVLKREPISSYDISRRVMGALEPSELELTQLHTVSTDDASASPFSGMLRSFISMGVAASVTAVIILGPNWLSKDDVNVQVSQPSVAAADVVQHHPLIQPVIFGKQPFTFASQGSLMSDSDIIRAPDGMQRYIDQHLSLVAPQPLQWGLAWLPEGYQNIRHESTRAGEVMVFSNGVKAFSVSVEQLGKQTMPEGVIDAGEFIALGQTIDNRFVTVVGDMPIMVAERIAASVAYSN